MQETKFKCDNCGAEYDEWRAYCRKCQATMPKKPVVTNETLEGCEKAQVCATIGSNSARYYSVFKENEDNTGIIITVCVAAAAVVLLGIFLVLKKRKSNHK